MIEPIGHTARRMNIRESLTSVNNTSFELSSQGASDVLVTFGTETGNSESVALQLAQKLHENGVPYKVSSLAELKPRALSRTDYLLLICSTHGDGDPPEPALPFYESLMETDVNLTKLKYAVLALGDSTYDYFCETGLRLDKRLASLGGKRLAERYDCDVDFEKISNDWIQHIVKLIPRTEVKPDFKVPNALTRETPPTNDCLYTKQNLLHTQVLENVCLSSAQRRRPYHHIELAVEPRTFSISPGDAIGLIPKNPEWLIDNILSATHLSGDEQVSLNGETFTLKKGLSEHLDLNIPSPGFLNLWASLSKDSFLLEQTDSNIRTQRTFLKTQQIIWLMEQYPGRPTAQALVDSLRPLQPRLYDVANYISSDSDEIHITVKDFHYSLNQKSLQGIASQHLLQLQPGDEVRIYPHTNKRFHLPENTGTPVILIAYGTGIAPYKAFMEKIEESEIANPCWLIFGEQHFEEDFLYQIFWQHAESKGILQHTDTVFYQGQTNRQLSDPLIEKFERLVEWLIRGAHIYLCGEKDILALCEKNLETHYNTRFGSTSWKMLTATKRIHRNLY